MQRENSASQPRTSYKEEAETQSTPRSGISDLASQLHFLSRYRSDHLNAYYREVKKQPTAYNSDEDLYQDDYTSTI